MHKRKLPDRLQLQQPARTNEVLRPTANMHLGIRPRDGWIHAIVKLQAPCHDVPFQHPGHLHVALGRDLIPPLIATGGGNPVEVGITARLRDPITGIDQPNWVVIAIYTAV